MTKKGEHHTEASKKKMSDAKKGKPSHRLGIPHTKEAKFQMAKAKKGKLGKFSNNWQGGKVELNKLIRNSDEYSTWRAEIFKRDSFTCEICKHVGGNLEAHHIKSFYLILREYDIKSLRDTLSCKELWDIKNGVCLCRKCHMRLHRSK